MAKKHLGNFPTLNLVEIDLILELVNKAGSFRLAGRIASKENYRNIRTAYTIALLSLAELKGNPDKIRTSALKKLQKVDTGTIGVKVTVEVEQDSAESFMDELRNLLDMYAVPIDNYKLEILK